MTPSYNTIFESAIIPELHGASRTPPPTFFYLENYHETSNHPRAGHHRQHGSRL